MKKETLQKIKTREFKSVTIDTPRGEVTFNLDDISYLFVDTYGPLELLIEGTTKSGNHIYFKSTDFNEEDIDLKLKE